MIQIYPTNTSTLVFNPTLNRTTQIVTPKIKVIISQENYHLKPLETPIVTKIFIENLKLNEKSHKK